MSFFFMMDQFRSIEQASLNEGRSNEGPSMEEGSYKKGISSDNLQASLLTSRIFGINE